MNISNPSSFALDKSGKKYSDFWSCLQKLIPDIHLENPMLTTTQEMYTFTRYGFLLLH
jgi:hypothetical protein